MPIGHGVFSTVGVPGQANPPRRQAESREDRSLRAYETLLIPNRPEKLRGYGIMATVPQTATGGLG